jgi:N-acetylmuramoyl-L-alanine amidase
MESKLNITDNLLTLGKRNRSGRGIIELRAVVLHWLDAPLQYPDQTRNYWERGVAAGSAHYVVGTNGYTIRTIPENEAAWHIGTSRPDPVSKRMYTGLARELFGDIVCDNGMCNFYALGIEMSHLNLFGDFTDETLETAAQLCADILRRYQKPVSILATHNQIVGWKDCPRLWTNNPDLFETFKNRVKAIY